MLAFLSYYYSTPQALLFLSDSGEKLNMFMQLCATYCPFFSFSNQHKNVDIQNIFPESYQRISECPFNKLSCIRTSLQHSCVTDVSITYLSQLNTMHCTSSSLSWQYRNAVVSAETEIQPLQLTTT